MSEGHPGAGVGRSPFKFLDPYGEKDRAIFFGREKETEALYHLLGESRLVLVYGRSGTGKTSLIQCGLANKFSATNWLPMMVRRGRNINAALLEAIAAQAISPIAAGTTLAEALRSIYLDHLRPIYLIFDQFEELFVLGDEEEQERFYAAVSAILQADIACRIIVSLREEYLAALDRFEQVVPSLFDKRLRVEPMTGANVERVILGTLGAHGIALENGSATARKIIAQINDSRNQVQLAYLQVYLDHLYRIGAQDNPPDAIVFTDAEVEEAGKLGDIMAGFLVTQEACIQDELEQRGCGIAKGGIARLMEEFVSAEGTKQPTHADQLLERVPGARPWLQQALDALVGSRLLRMVDAHFELAHDALATHIAERRSDEAKQVLYAERLVRNCMEDFPQTRTLLNPEELTLINRAQKQRDPIDGSLRLKFGSEAADFVRRSRSALRRRRIRRIASLALTFLIPFFLIVLWLASLQETDEARAKASNETDLLGYTAFNRFYNGTDPDHDDNWSRVDCDYQEEACRQAFQAYDALEIHAMASDINARREVDPDVTGEAFERTFWRELASADREYRRDARKGAERYAALLAEQRKALAELPTDPGKRVRLKAVLWHMHFTRMKSQWEAPDDAQAIPDVAPELFRLLDQQIREQRENGVDPETQDLLGFYQDAKNFCVDIPAEGKLPDGCTEYAIAAANEAGAKPPPEEVTVSE